MAEWLQAYGPTLGALVPLLVFAAALTALVRTTDVRCSARLRGWQCVHDEDHPGSHRDERGNYWNTHD